MTFDRFRAILGGAWVAVMPLAVFGSPPAWQWLAAFVGAGLAFILTPAKPLADEENSPACTG